MPDSHDLDRALVDALGDDALRSLATRLRPYLVAPADSEHERWYTADDAAVYLGCRSRRRVYDLVYSGRLRAARDGSRLRFRRGWLDAALDGVDSLAM